MNDLLFYLLESGLGLAVFYGVYQIFLANGTNHHFNRIYLIVTALFSFLFPFFQVGIPMITDKQSSFVVVLDAVTVTSVSLQSAIVDHQITFQAVALIYFAGVFLFLMRLFVQLLQLRRLFKKSHIIRRNNLTIVLVDRGYAPFSFFNLIFVPRGKINRENADEIIAHEQIHITQIHSFDRMLFEVMTIIQWFNPVIWLYKESVKTVHEYLADEGVIAGGFDIIGYQKLLFGLSFENNINALTNKFNHSLIKKRIKMMTKNKTNFKTRLKLMIALPVTLLLGLSLIVLPMLQSCRQDVQQDNSVKQQELTADQQQANNESKTQITENEEQPATDDEIYTIADVMPEFPGGQKAMRKYLMTAITYPEKAKKAKIEGKVYVSFVVEKDGSISNVELLRGFDKECDEAAMKAVKEMPKWKPGLKQDQPVRIRFNMPVLFKLN